MTRDDILAFAQRDWAAVTDAKARFWAGRKATMTASEALACADMLRRHVRALKPGWPDARERAEDLDLHLRLSEALRAVPEPWAR